MDNVIKYLLVVFFWLIKMLDWIVEVEMILINNNYV